MRGLENDEYVRQIEGYLPTAEVAFIDEIFKANSAILNALLTLLNERLFDNGNQRFGVPLLCMVRPSQSILLTGAHHKRFSQRIWDMSLSRTWKIVGSRFWQYKTSGTL